MITRADLPDQLNLATWFVDLNVEDGRGDRTALIDADGATTYAELARLVNRYGNLLHELGAIKGPTGVIELTDLGRRLSRLPVDPRLGRMILEADARHCASEVIVLAAALSPAFAHRRDLRQAARAGPG